MRLFSATSSPVLSNSRSLKDRPTDGEYVEEELITRQRHKRRLIKRDGPTNQPQISDTEIREKLMNSTELLRKKKIAQEKLTRETSTFMEEKPKGDIDINDPNSPVTVGKLKDLVSGGGFNFSDKEKSVLEEILKNR